MSDRTEKNIVNLEDYGQIRRGLGNGPGCQALRDAHKLASERLRHLIEHMMDKVDDALFSRAEKAENNMAQTQYFDAMRELRIIRKDIEEDFTALLTTRFNKGVPRSTEMSGSLSLSWDEGNSELGLVDKNDLEEDLAVSSMVNKIRGNCTQTLYALDRRIGFLIGDPDLERWQNPMGPESICDAFREAADRIETGLEIRLVIFKLFDQYVVTHMDALYKEVNQHLIKLGVLPEIKTVIRKSSYALPPSSQPAGNSGAQGGARAEIPAGAGYDPAHVAGGTAGVYSYGYSSMPRSIGALTFLQHGGNPEGDLEALQISNADLVSGQVNILHGIKGSPLAQDLGKTGDMTIGIVAMLFDYILDDRNIPDAMRALLGRLQIPVLKVALLDREFFSRKSHPARQLLNRLAATAVGWDEQQGNQDPVYKKIEAIVQTILEQFEDNVELFGQLLDDFESFLQKVEEQAALRAERSARVMEGQERLEVAKSTTMEEIEPRISDEVNLDFVRDFIAGRWKNLLFICCARNGKDSDAWKQAVATMDDLIWSIKPKRTPEERQRLVKMQPQLLANLRSGMERLSIPATERDDFIAMLVRAHGRTAINKTDPEPEPATQAEKAEKAPQSEVNRRTPDACVETETAIASSATEDDVHDQYTARASQLAPGTWLEFLGSDGQATRAKLSWISPITGTLLFTDRQGLKAGNYGIQDLARLFRGRRAKILNASPLMDRAVSTVLKEYQKS
ncbi:MAG: DUF1631 domain-containing protein [Thiogranum sp.]|nr:DUF1631 domain-containing protein [Thiogranum sp.]